MSAADSPELPTRQWRSRSGNPRVRNDPALYDELADQWWARRGAFVTLHWLAAARARLIPPAPRPGAVLLDVACGGGLLAPHLADTGYRHIGIDYSPAATRVARAHGVSAVTRGDVRALPIGNEVADVVVAGEILEHVEHPSQLVGECARVLRPGGTLVLDTVAATTLARFLVVTLGERVLGLLPTHIHDPALFIDRDALVHAAAEHGIALRLQGLRPNRSVLAWLAHQRETVQMIPTRSTTVLFQGIGTKHPAACTTQ